MPMVPEPTSILDEIIAMVCGCWIMLQQFGLQVPAAQLMLLAGAAVVTVVLLWCRSRIAAALLALLTLGGLPWTVAVLAPLGMGVFEDAGIQQHVLLPQLAWLLANLVALAGTFLHHARRRRVQGVAGAA